MAEPQKLKSSLTKRENYNYDNWTIETIVSHIMGSQCENNHKCKSSEDDQNLCNVCSYEKELTLPSLPDMVFANNRLIIHHDNGGSIEFNTLDALKEVGKYACNIEVAHAKVWQEARKLTESKKSRACCKIHVDDINNLMFFHMKEFKSECQFAKRIVKNYDWTYSTSYSGTIKGPLKSTPTEERINLEKLKIPEEILFYKEIYLYEDELDDNGCTRCSVKVRVMPSGFFAVFRHYLRVDHVIIRVSDTRLYYEKGKEGILRERSTRESPMEKLKVDVNTYKNPDLIWQYLPLIEQRADMICPIK